MIQHLNKLVFLAIFLIIKSSISSGQVYSEFDKSVDFTRFKTYSFLGWQKDCDLLLNDNDKKKILAAIKKEMGDRNIQFSADNGDMELTIFLIIDPKTSITNYMDYNTGHYNSGWGWGSNNTSYSTHEARKGTLIVDLYMASSMKLVWEGMLKKTIAENPERRVLTIPGNISKILRKFPVKPVRK